MEGDETSELCGDKIKNGLLNHDKWIRERQNQFQGSQLQHCSWDMRLLNGKVSEN